MSREILVREESIKVEPYWNVKSQLSCISGCSYPIKVEPYWNVKKDLAEILFGLESIKVEPYWNVKWLMKTMFSICSND